MERSECLYQLKTQFFKDTNQKNNISKLATAAWWKDKLECIENIGWVSKVKLALSNM